MRAIAFHRPSTVRSSALREFALGLEKAILIELRSGEQVGRRSSALAAVILSRSPVPSWLGMRTFCDVLDAGCPASLASL